MNVYKINKETIEKIEYIIHKEKLNDKIILVNLCELLNLENILAISPFFENQYVISKNQFLFFKAIS